MVLILIIGGGTYYFLVVDNREECISEIENQILSTDTIKESTKENLKVIDGIEYNVNYLAKDRKIKIPQIINGGKNANILNKEIASKTLEKTYNMIADGFEIGLTTKYNYKIENNILVIVTSVEYDMWPASGNGIFTFNFFYDIENDKILNLYEALPLIGFTEEKIKKIGASSFEDFRNTEGRDTIDERFWITYLLIENNEFVIKFKETNN